MEEKGENKTKKGGKMGRTGGKWDEKPETPRGKGGKGTKKGERGETNGDMGGKRRERRMKMLGLRGHLFGYRVLYGRNPEPKGDVEIEIGGHPNDPSSKLNIISRQREHMRTKTCATSTVRSWKFLA